MLPRRIELLAKTLSERPLADYDAHVVLEITEISNQLVKGLLNTSKDELHHLASVIINALEPSVNASPVLTVTTGDFFRVCGSIP